MKGRLWRFKKKMLLVFAVALALAGAAPVLYFVALFAWQLGTLFLTKAWVALPASLLFTEHSFAFVPRLASAPPEALAWILARLHVGLVFAIPGLVLATLGSLGARRKATEIRVAQRRDEDRLRRLNDYRRADLLAEGFDGRREPFIGPAEIHQNAKRRVA